MPDHIVIVHPMDSFHPEAGGGIRYLMNILSAFVERRYQVTVLGYHIAEPPAFPSWRQINLCDGGPGKWSRFLVSLYTRLPFIELPEKAVILVHRMDCMLAFVLFKRSHHKVLISAAPMYYLRLRFPVLFPVLRRLYQAAERVCISGLDVLVPVDRATEEYYVRRYPKLAGRVARIPSSIPLQQFKLQDRTVARQTLGLPTQERIVIYVGRLSPVKNVPFLIQSFKIVNQCVPNSRLLIVGSGESEAELRDMAANCEYVTFAGAVAPDQVPLYLNAADVLALCSIEEGSPMVVKEALACGVPVVSTDVGDVRAVLSTSGELGTIVPANHKDFADALTHWLVNGQGEDTARTRRRHIAQQYDTGKIGAQFIRICSDLLEGSQR